MYIDVSYITDRVRHTVLVDITDDGSTQSDIVNEAKINLIIADVESLVNNVLRKRYVIPLAAVSGESSAFSDGYKTIQELAFRLVMNKLHTDAHTEMPADYAGARKDLDYYDTGETIIYGCQLKTGETTGIPLIIAGNKTSTDKIYNATFFEGRRL